MDINIRYDNPDAQVQSLRGNPIKLFAFGVQGHDFTPGSSMQIGRSPVRFYTGVTITSLNPNTFGLLVPVHDSEFSIATGATVFTPNNLPISLNMLALGGSNIIEYGTHIANLYFLQGAY